jgi:hypothetical protein
MQRKVGARPFPCVLWCPVPVQHATCLRSHTCWFFLFFSNLMRPRQSRHVVSLRQQRKRIQGRYSTVLQVCTLLLHAPSAEPTALVDISPFCTVELDRREHPTSSHRGGQSALGWANTAPVVRDACLRVEGGCPLRNQVNACRCIGGCISPGAPQAAGRGHLQG